MLLPIYEDPYRYSIQDSEDSEEDRLQEQRNELDTDGADQLIFNTQWEMNMSGPTRAFGRGNAVSASDIVRVRETEERLDEYLTSF